MSTPTLMITENDSRKLRRLLEHANFVDHQERVYWDALEAEIEKAEVVPTEQIPRNVVTMHSRVRITDLRTGQELVFQIVYPSEANYAEHKISVLAPIGLALLGYPSGTEIIWTVPSGTRKLRIEAVEQADTAVRLRSAA
jgi:regulator of nucleoside diphosphate kinase